MKRVLSLFGKARVAGAALRVGGLGVKFLLLFGIGLWLPLSDVAVYGYVIAASVVYSKVAGLGFGLWNNRHIVGLDADVQRQAVRRQFGFHLLVHVVVGALVGAALPFLHGFAVVVGLSYVICVFEHLVMEFYQLLMARKLTLQANGLMFISTAGWGVGFLLAAACIPGFRALDALLVSWVVGGCIAVSVGAFLSWDLLRGGWPAPRLDTGWVRAAFRPAMAIYLTTIFLAVGLYIDRAVGALLVDGPLMGVFVIFWGLANAVMSIVQAAVIHPAFAHLVEARKSLNGERFRRLSHDALRDALIWSLAGFAGLLVLAGPLVHLLGKPLAEKCLPLLPVICAAALVRIVAECQSYEMYAAGRDGDRMKATLWVLVPGFAISAALASVYGLTGLVVSQLVYAVGMVLAFSVRRGLVLASFAVVCGLGLAPSAHAEPATRLGVQLKYLDATASDMAQIHELGFTAVRLGVRRVLLDPSDTGVYDWARLDGLMQAASTNKLAVLMTLIEGKPTEAITPPRTPAETARFAAFAAATVARYDAQGVTAEIWNEPDNPRFWSPTPIPHDYAALAAATCQAIRGASPQTPIYAGALANSPNEPGKAQLTYNLLLPLVKSGCLTGISLHPYRHSAPETVMAEVENLRRESPQVPLIFSEWGYSRRGDGHSKERRDAYLARILLSSYLLRLPMAVLYEWRNSGTDPHEREDNFGIVTGDRQPTPALRPIREVLHFLAAGPETCEASKPDAFCLSTGGPQRLEWTSSSDELPPIPQ